MASLLEVIPRVKYCKKIPVLILVSFQKVPNCAVSFLNDTNHCEVIIYWGLTKILNMTIHDKIYKVKMQKYTINGTVPFYWYQFHIILCKKVPLTVLYHFIGTNTVPYHFILIGVHS